MAQNKGFQKGCGCMLAIIGALVMACSVIFGVAMYCADESAGEENKAEWAAYSEHQATIDSLYEAGVPDSVVCERYPQPVVRQGGFATAFGVICGLAGAVVGFIPLAIGLILWFTSRKKPLPPPESFKKDI